VGGSGTVSVDGKTYELEKLDSLYVGMGVRDVRFASASAADPAKFYLVSTPAHAAHATTRIPAAATKRMSLGIAETANARTIDRRDLPADPDRRCDPVPVRRRPPPRRQRVVRLPMRVPRSLRARSSRIACREAASLEIASMPCIARAKPA
jgi:hypothetical protein